MRYSFKSGTQVKAEASATAGASEVILSLTPELPNWLTPACLHPPLSAPTCVSAPSLPMQCLSCYFREFPGSPHTASAVLINTLLFWSLPIGCWPVSVLRILKWPFGLSRARTGRLARLCTHPAPSGPGSHKVLHEHSSFIIIRKKPSLHREGTQSQSTA